MGWATGSLNSSMADGWSMRDNGTRYPFPAGLVEGDKGPLLTLIDVAKRYRKNVDTVRRWMKRPDFPKPIIFSGRLMFYLLDLVEWERQRVVQSTREVRAAHKERMPDGTRGRYAARKK
jgi:hypothetical protein